MLVTKKMKNKKSLLIILILVFLVGFIGVVTYLKVNNIALPGQSVDKKIATDPNFVEVEGKLIDGFPEIPVYPDAELVGSSKPNGNFEETQGYRAKWYVSGTVMEVMDWYIEELSMKGWTIVSPNDSTAVGEQVTDISNNEFKGYLAVEVDDEKIEIVVDLRKIN